MRHYTSIEQSKRLIGILHEGSADLVYAREGEVPMVRGKIRPLSSNEVPCWSTGALMDMLPDGKDYPPLKIERGGYVPGGSYTHNWYLIEEGDEYISDNDYELVELLVRAIERIYKNDKKEE